MKDNVLWWTTVAAFVLGLGSYAMLLALPTVPNDEVERELAAKPHLGWMLYGTFGVLILSLIAGHLGWLP